MYVGRLWSTVRVPPSSLAPHGVSQHGRGAAQRAACLELCGGRGLACRGVLDSGTSRATSCSRVLCVLPRNCAAGLCVECAGGRRFHARGACACCLHSVGQVLTPSVGGRLLDSRWFFPPPTCSCCTHRRARGFGLLHCLCKARRPCQLTRRACAQRALLLPAVRSSAAGASSSATNGAKVAVAYPDRAAMQARACHACFAQ